jgi:hypothetical protein
MYSEGCFEWTPMFLDTYSKAGTGRTYLPMTQQLLFVFQLFTCDDRTCSCTFLRQCGTEPRFYMLNIDTYIMYYHIWETSVLQ